jgi:hypothetical protein
VAVAVDVGTVVKPSLAVQVVVVADVRAVAHMPHLMVHDQEDTVA